MGQRARGSRHQGMGVGNDYLAKGFNLFKRSPQIPLTLTDAKRCGQVGEDLFLTSPPSRQSATINLAF